MYTDTAACLRAIQAKDARFDGRFFTAVLSTGIYCRPSCPARTPQARNVRFYPTAAAAQLAGFRACKRCVPGATSGSPEWDVRGDVLARAVRLIDDGVVDREGVAGLASRLGYSTRQVQRLLTDGTGAGPLALARARRAQTARTLLEATELSHAEIAFAAGFSSVRSFNATMQEVYATTPRELRNRSTRRRTAADGGLTFIDLELPVRQPFCPCNVFGHLIATSIDGVESFHDGAYHRTLRLPAGHAVVSLRPGHDGVSARIGLSDLGQLPTVVSRVRRLLDLDADPVAIDDFLAEDPVFAPLVAAHPGGGSRAGSTATRWPSAFCSASRSRRPRHARTGRGSSPPSATRSTARSPGSPISSRPPSRSSRQATRRSPSLSRAATRSAAPRSHSRRVTSTSGSVSTGTRPARSSVR